MKIKEFHDIYRRVFGDSERWRRWFFSEVVDESGIYLAREASGKANGSLLMQPYTFLFHGAEIPAGYMSCVATSPEARGRGIAAGLIRQALSDARRDGQALCTLVPAAPHLFYFYARFGFSTVFYVNRERYTALHRFDPCGCSAVMPNYDLFSRLERDFGCGVLHTREQFDHIVADNSIDGGSVIAVRDADGAGAIVFAVEEDNIVRVKCLLADNAATAEGVLAELRAAAEGKAVTVSLPPLSGEKRFLRPYGMGRVVNPLAILSPVASSHPELRYAIRVTDPILPENNGVYTLRDGESRRPDAFGGHIDLDVTIDILASALFSSEAVGRVLELPARRPYMALMLD